MIQDPQEYLHEWLKTKNPFYPNEMRWDRVKVNIFLKDYKEQLNTNETEKIKTVIDLLSEHADLNAEFDNTSPDDKFAHIHGLCIKMLNEIINN